MYCVLLLKRIYEGNIMGLSITFYWDVENCLNEGQEGGDFEEFSV